MYLRLIKNNTNKLFLIIVFLILFCKPSCAAVLIKSSCENNKLDAECVALDGIKYIYIYDEIDGDTARRISAIAGLIPLNKSFPQVYINSRGGNPRYSREIGRLLRLRSASIEGRDMISPNREPLCSSACVEIAAGAVKRNLIHMEVHKGHIKRRIKGELYSYEEMTEEHLKKTYEYYNEMGLSEINDYIKNTSNDKEWYELRYNISEPLQQQEIFKIGFLIDESRAKELFKIKILSDHRDWNGTEAYQKRAQNGDADAAYKLAHRYYYGTDGEEQNYNKAIEWYNKAGSLGNALGYYMLGIIYDQDDKAGKKDPFESFKYYKKAAEMGFAGSQNNLACSYLNGRGVSKNIPEAIYWVTKAVEQGDPFAYSTLAEMRYEGNGFQRDDVETLKWFSLAVNKMPKGNSRDKDLKLYEELKSKMTEEKISEAMRLADSWKPLKDSGARTRDKDDK